MSSSRPRSSTVLSTASSSRTDSSREFWSGNPQTLLAAEGESPPAIPIPGAATKIDPANPSAAFASKSWASAHSLATIRPGARRDGGGASAGSDYSDGDDSSSFDDSEPGTRSSTARPVTGPRFIFDLASPASPAPSATTYATAHSSPSVSSLVLPLPAANRRRSASNASNASTVSLRLGGASEVPQWVPAPLRDWLLDHPIALAGIKAGLLFAMAVGSLAVLLHVLLPDLDEADKEHIKLPKSFADLKALNEVLQIYKDRNYWRVLGCYITVYLFLQAFSIPGSMYLTILGGALYGVPMALPLACFCVATGALLCYLISLQLGPALLLNSDKWQRRIEAWRVRIEGHREDLISYLIVLRVAPLPPHWVVNVVAPHLGIQIWPFWISTFFGIMGVSFIHTQIGTTLDQMTGSSDFNLFSWQNGVGLGGIMLAVLVPVYLRRKWKKDLDAAATADDDADVQDSSPLLPSSQTPHVVLTPPTKVRLEYLSDEEDDEDARSFVGHAVFDLEEDGEDEDGQEGKGKGREVERAPSRGGGGGGGRGNLDKASRVLGVEVGGGRVNLAGGR